MNQLSEVMDGNEIFQETKSDLVMLFLAKHVKMSLLSSKKPMTMEWDLSLTLSQVTDLSYAFAAILHFKYLKS